MFQFASADWLVVLAVSNLVVLLGTWFVGRQERRDMQRNMQARIDWLVNDNADLRSQIRVLNRLLGVPSEPVPPSTSGGININLSQEATTGARTNPVTQHFGEKK